VTDSHAQGKADDNETYPSDLYIPFRVIISHISMILHQVDRKYHATTIYVAFSERLANFLMTGIEETNIVNSIDRKHPSKNISVVVVCQLFVSIEGTSQK
jgi:hypothetical protein